MYLNPVKVIESNSWEKTYEQFSKNLKIKKPLLVTSTGCLSRNKLADFFNPNSIYSNILPDPTLESCNSAIKKSNLFDHDGLIAIGGGSVMDTAKVILAAMNTELRDFNKLLEIKDSYKKRIPSIFVPTTHGTGSEVTKWATVWDLKNKKKLSLSHTDLYPKFVILDQNLTLTLPLKTSIITILDALSHSFESIWNKNANDISSNYAIEAITNIINNIDLFKSDPKNPVIRKKLLIASNKAGLAFSNTKTAAAHSISYPLTIHFSIPHGVAASISLVPILNLTKSLIKKPLDVILKNTSCTFDELTKRINLISKDVVPFRLNKWGVGKKNIDYLAQESFTKGRMENTIVDINKDLVMKILNQIY